MITKHDNTEFTSQNTIKNPKTFNLEVFGFSMVRDEGLEPPRSPARS